MFISSPNYPRNYPNNAYRLWKVQAQDGLVLSLLLQLFDIHVSDSLYLGDGVDTSYITGDANCHWQRVDGLNTEFTSRSSLIKVIFTSDYRYDGGGFVLQLRAFKPLSTRSHKAGMYNEDLSAYTLYLS